MLTIFCKTQHPYHLSNSVAADDINKNDLILQWCIQ